jgi:hypothetical protein
VTYTSWRRDRLLEATERNGTFAATFVEKLQQAASDNSILHKLRQYALHPAQQQLSSTEDNALFGMPGRI